MYTGDKRIRIQPVRLHVFNALDVVGCAAGSRHSILLASVGDSAYGGNEQPLAMFKHTRGTHNPKYGLLRQKIKELGTLPDAETIFKLTCDDSSLRYCLDTVPSQAGETHRRYTYETVVSCYPCRQTPVCRACARWCHQSHNSDAFFTLWKHHEDICACARSGSCRIRWSRTRAVFDGLVAVTAGGENRGLPSLHISRLRELLQLLHPDSLSEDDIDSGEVALYSLHGKLTWFQFEQWHEPYFKEKEQETERPYA